MYRLYGIYLILDGATTLSLEVDEGWIFSLIQPVQGEEDEREKMI